MSTNSTHAKAARAHLRMKGILDHHRERPWMTWLVGLVLVSPILLLIGLALADAF